MTGLPRIVVRANGQPIRLGRQLGQGGEGVVVEVAGQSDLAIKLYHPNKIASQHEKLTAMINAGLSHLSGFVAFPTEIIFSETGQFVGFAMRKVGEHTRPELPSLKPSRRQTCRRYMTSQYTWLQRSRRRSGEKELQIGPLRSNGSDS
jgi:DNA-binding helix-hairpin-helix protein with protein kinase domain